MSYDPTKDIEVARQHLALALDVADRASALELARSLQPFFSVAKVGLELFVAEGPGVVRDVADAGFDVFLDLKLHDIPNTVGRAAARAGSLKARYLTVHSAGGTEMLRAAVEAYGSVTGRAGVLAVTVLTSEKVATHEEIAERAQLAAATGCAGVVCAASDLSAVTTSTSGLTIVVPGIRLPGAARDDQSRIATPGQAVKEGADLLVIGRTVTNADDPQAAAGRVARDVAQIGLAFS